MVSILLPTYNRVDTLKRAIKSIQAQSFKEWELIVLNDASTDGTKAFLDELAHADPRVRPVHHAKNYYPDISRSLNEGMQSAKGEYIARLDDDDYWCDDDKLKKQVVFLDSHPDYLITGGGVIAVDESDKEKLRYLNAETDDEIRRKALLLNPFAHSTVMFRRAAALAAGGYADTHNTEDWDLWLRLGLKGKFYNFQEYFVRYRMTEQNKTFVFKRSQAKEILANMRRHRREYPGFFKAYTVGLMQYTYSMFPLWLRRSIYGFAYSLKRLLK